MTVAVSTIVLALIAAGLYFRRRAEIHMPLMIGAFVIDLGLVLYIEWSRHAVEQLTEGVSAPSDHAFLLFHIAVSLLTLLLYVSLLVSGMALFKNNQAARRWHRGLAGFFLLCRLTNYVTSFWLL